LLVVVAVGNEVAEVVAEVVIEQLQELQLE
jgi:hypothetical protein